VNIIIARLEYNVFELITTKTGEQDGSKCDCGLLSYD